MLLLLAFIVSLFSISEAVDESGEHEYSTMPPLYMDNWTSCEEFLYNTTFDKLSIVEKNWKIFYFWSSQMELSYNIIFHIPSGTLIDRFRIDLDDDVITPVNWTSADFFMESTIDFSALFLQTNVSGLYTIIPSIAFHGMKSVPKLLFALKLVEPGYLGIVNCQFRIAYALAPAESMPPTSELAQAAAKLNFTSDYGYPYTVEDPVHETLSNPDRIQDDATHDEELQIEVDSDNLDIF